MFVDYWKKLKGEERTRFELNYEKAARKEIEAPLPKGAPVGKKPDLLPMNSADIEGFVGVSQYIEATFKRFDLDNNGKLDKKEAQPAFLVFRRSLNEVIAAERPELKLSEGDIKGMFEYLLIHGEQPTEVGFILQKIFGIFMSIDADRGTLMSILARLSMPAAPSATTQAATVAAK